MVLASKRQKSYYAAVNRVELLTTDLELPPIAESLSTLLLDESNIDIANKFPATARRYANPDTDLVTENLYETAEDSMPGVRRQFIVFAGNRAVGMSMIRHVDNYPNCVDPDWPNLSGFVCAPYRGQGLGSLSLRTRLGFVDREFGGVAWSKVKIENIPSHRIMEKNGLVVIGKDDEYITYKYTKV
jgi:RimJ/RimL family protein N-acetyltransferase